MQASNECFAPISYKEVEKFGGGSVMMWATISYISRTNLVRVQKSIAAQRYTDDIFPQHMLAVID
jgi:hypothetical protein